ncbi:MAG: PAS-domain containing protein [Pseudomonadota bacterium]
MAARRADTAEHMEASHVFRFENKELVEASKAAQDTLNLEDLDEDIFYQLLDRLSSVFPEMRAAYSEAEATGTAFSLTDVTQTGPVSVSVAFDGPRTQVEITGIPAPLSRKLIVDEDFANATATELRVLRDTVEASPVPTWREDARGTIDWVNRAYLDLIEQAKGLEETTSSWPPARLFASSTVVKPGEPASPKRSSVQLENKTTRWFDVTSFGLGDHSLHFATDSNGIVKAEESLRNFLQTLTQTFAYLPIGLAIFDRNRQLVLFNPSLMNLTSLEPEWLSVRPTLFDFLNKLREKRMLPEQKNFSDWRAKIAQLEKSAVDGTYSETWTLPTSQTYRITGRPHPEGAIAFLFEDITAEISLTRKFRQELELSQSLFDSFSEAIAVFGSDGIVNMSNLAYANLWNVDPNDTLGQISILDATRLWQSETRPTPLWGDARDFIALKGDRSEWYGTAKLQSGETLNCRFTPLTGGATLVGFSVEDMVAAPAQSPVIGDTVLLGS